MKLRLYHLLSEEFRLISATENAFEHFRRQKFNRPLQKVCLYGGGYQCRAGSAAFWSASQRARHSVKGSLLLSQLCAYSSRLSVLLKGVLRKAARQCQTGSQDIARCCFGEHSGAAPTS